MTHIFTEGGKGSSKLSLFDAVNNAMGDALKGHNFGGDHLCTFTIVMDGYEYDGKEYRVKLKVVIYDYELAHKDYYHALEKHRHEMEEQNVVGAYFMASHFAHIYHHHKNHFADRLKEVLEQEHNIPHMDTISYIAPDHVHQHLALEMGYDPQLVPVYPRPHTDLPEPTLGPGVAGSAENESTGRAS